VATILSNDLSQVLYSTYIGGSGDEMARACGLGADGTLYVGEFVLPGLLKISTVRKPATKARKGVNPFTKEEVMFKARPASTAVKVRPLKGLRDMAG